VFFDGAWRAHIDLRIILEPSHWTPTGNTAELEPQGQPPASSVREHARYRHAQIESEQYQN
jgi:hypothetical protein